MMHSINGMHGFELRATDGEIGHVHDFLVHDKGWAVRYLVADTRLIFGRRVLLAPDSLGEPDEANRQVPVALTRDKIRHSPDVDTDQPVSRQHETRLYGYYGWAPYWGGPFGAGDPAFGTGPHLVYPPRPETVGPPPEGAPEATEGDPHLRSLREVDGYDVAATDGEAVGTVTDFLLDADGWVIRYLVVDTGRWLPGRKVLVAPGWARRVEWVDGRIELDRDREQVRTAPEYDPDAEFGRPYETQLHDHYGFKPYW